MFRKLAKLLRDPVGVLSRRWMTMVERLRFAGGGDYRTADYWNYRHGKYGFDLRGVGDKSKSHEENVKLLEQGSRVFLAVCREAKIPFRRARVLDIGCGTGHFAEVLRNNGVKDYLGVDNVDTLFQGLHARLPGFRFEQVDIATQRLRGTYDLIAAMDVLQHIANEEKFAFALENIRSHLAPSGTVVISTHLGPYRREAFYFIRRPLEAFQKFFPGFAFSTPVAYADSFVFSLRRNQKRASAISSRR
ncbi:MAG: class I SAM-dependent methyltransferase [Ignavibacteriales bacterium]|nr:class I SAM-dependent methyltransferase [Ignavibacteriales bacterium]